MAMYPRDRASSAGRVDQHPFPVFHRAFKANQTADDDIAWDVPTATRPQVAANNGIHELQAGTKLLVIPYGTDAADETFRVGVQLWHPLYDRIEAVKDTEDVAWIGHVGAIVDCTLGAANNPAAAAGPLTTSDLFCDTIALAGSTTQPGVSVNGIIPGSDPPTKAIDMFTVETNGAKYVKFYTDRQGSAATVNALFAMI